MKIIALVLALVFVPALASAQDADTEATRAKPPAVDPAPIIVAAPPALDPFVSFTLETLPSWTRHMSSTDLRVIMPLRDIVFFHPCGGVPAVVDDEGVETTPAVPPIGIRTTLPYSELPDRLPVDMIDFNPAP